MLFFSVVTLCFSIIIIEPYNSHSNWNIDIRRFKRRSSPPPNGIEISYDGWPLIVYNTGGGNVVPARPETCLSICHII